MKRFKNFFVFVLGMTLFLGFTQFADAGKLGYLDLSKIFYNYQKTKEFDAVLEQKNKDFEKDRNVKIEKLKEAQGKLALMVEKEQEKMKADVEQMRQDLIAYDQAQRTDLTKQQDEKTREILLEIEKVVSEFSKKEGYDLILNDRVLIYGDTTMDITDAILTKMNESYNKK